MALHDLIFCTCTIHLIQITKEFSSDYCQLYSYSCTVYSMPFRVAYFKCVFISKMHVVCIGNIFFFLLSYVLIDQAENLNCHGPLLTSVVMRIIKLSLLPTVYKLNTYYSRAFCELVCCKET